MNKSTTLSAISQKVAELEAQVTGNKEEDKSVGRLKRQARALKVCAALIDAYAPEDFSIGALDTELSAMITPKKGKEIIIDVNEGDNVLQVLEANQNIKDAYNRILKTCARKGLKIVGCDIVKA